MRNANAMTIWYFPGYNSTWLVGAERDRRSQARGGGLQFHNSSDERFDKSTIFKAPFFFNPASSFPEIYLIVIFTPQWNDTDKNIFCNRERLETTEMSISRWLVKWITVCPLNGIRGDHQKKMWQLRGKRAKVYCTVRFRSIEHNRPCIVSYFT